MLGKAGLATIAVIIGVIGAGFALNPRELYNQMYPVEALKRDAFHICHNTNPSFVRALEVDREGCFDSMPQAIALAIGWVRPQAALWAEALRDPSRNVELLMALAALPLRQPATVPRSFDNYSWVHALSPSCETGTATPAPTDPAAAVPFGSVTADALGRPLLDRLVPGPRAAKTGVAADRPLPLVPLTDSTPMTLSAPALPGSAGKTITAYDTLTASDVGDNPEPAIVPLASAAGCRGGA